MRKAPQLKACVVYQLSNSRIVIEQAENSFRIDFEQGETPAFMAVHALLDGRSSLGSIQASTKIPLKDLQHVVDTLRGAGLLSEPYPHPDIEAGYFAERLHAVCRMWRRHMLSHELFRELKARDAPRSLLEALLIQTYFYIRYSEQAIAEALRKAGSSALKPILADLASDERGHGAFLVRCLENIGWTEERLLSCQPAIATEAVGLLMRRVAQEDSLCFLALLSISESSPEELDPGLAYVSELERCHGLSEGALNGLREHLLLDGSGEHSSAIQRAGGVLGKIDVSRAEAALNSAHRFKHFLDNMHDGILAMGTRASGVHSGAVVSLRQIL